MAGISSLGSGGSAASHSGPSRTPGRVNLSALEQQCHSFLLQGLAPSTRRSYASAQAQFISFCSQLGKLHASGSPCPADEWTLCLFATFLANRIQHSSIKVYLSGVRALHIEQGFPDPLANCLHLQRVVRGIKRCQGSSSSSRLPITDDLMLLIWRSLDLRLPDHLMFWAACSLGYFGFLRASEFTVPNLASFSPSLHLAIQDIAVDSLSAPACMHLKIKGSETDPFRKGAYIHIGRGQPPLCAVHSAISYLASRGDRSGPLFLFQNGQPLSRALLTDWLRQILAAANVPGNFSSHSFRIGAATVAVRNRVPDHLIQALVVHYQLFELSLSLCFNAADLLLNRIPFAVRPCFWVNADFKSCWLPATALNALRLPLLLSAFTVLDFAV